MAEFKMDFDDRFLRRGFVDMEKAFTIAAENTLNIQAAITRRNAIKNVKSDFINRSTFTERSIQFEKASSDNISGLVSKAGALERAGYMSLQEIGGARKPARGDTLAIPTTKTARGGSKTALVKKPLYLSNLRPKIVHGPYKNPTATNKQKFYASLYVAIRENKLMAVNDGLYSVNGQIAKGKIKKANMELVYTLEKGRVNVKTTPWLEPATIKPIEDAQFIFNGQIFKLLKKEII